MTRRTSPVVHESRLMSVFNVNSRAGMVLTPYAG